MDDALVLNDDDPRIQAEVAMIWQVFAQGLRLLSDYVERKTDRHERHIIDLLRAAWVVR